MPQAVGCQSQLWTIINPVIQGLLEVLPLARDCNISPTPTSMMASSTTHMLRPRVLATQFRSVYVSLINILRISSNLVTSQGQNFAQACQI